MISRKRLEELIKQEATIWVKNQYYNAYDVELSNYNYVAITDNKESLMFLDYSIQEDDPESVLVDYLENLYETKEDAEFAKEFKNITRTEILNLPTFEELKKFERFDFKSKDGHRYTIHFISCFNTLAITGIIKNEYYGEATKANYIKACTIARKLFLGENVDGI